MTRPLFFSAALCAATTLPTLVHAQAGGGIGLIEPPACAIEGTLSPVAVRVGLNGGAVTAVSGNGAAGRVIVRCNSLQAAVFIGSNAMVNPAAIAATETNIFANRIHFAAYARRVLTGDLGWRIASRPGVANGAWQSAYVPARIVALDVFATSFETLTKMPVAGDYKGQICITVSPSGLPAPTNAVGSAGCAGPS
jgi:hypothetical protein